MTAFALLPPIPKPPHDPTSWLLNSVVGWRRAGLLDKAKTPVLESPGLTLLGANERTLTESSGAFGGLALPSNVALDCEGHLYLLDRKRALLKLFDPCDCAFKVVSGVGGSGTGPRKLSAPNGIGVCSTNIY